MFLFKKYNIVIVSVILSFNLYAKLKPSDFELVEPQYVRGKNSYYEDFVKKKGGFVIYKSGTVFLNELCNLPSLDQTERFKDKNMYPFVVFEDGEVVGAIRTNTGAKVKHLALAKNRNIIGGGLISCRMEEDKSIFDVSNSSGQYCFPMLPLSFALKHFKKSGADLGRFFLKFKRKKFCRIEKNREVKYQKIISGKFLDFGYKKNHIFTGTKFLKRFYDSK